MKKKFLITGAGGLLGRYLTRKLSGDGEVLALSHADLDVSDKNSVAQVLSDFRPQVVVNCAALSNVDRCESEQALAFKVNAEGPLSLARACRRIGAELVHMSTDYVFDGEKTSPYTIEDEPHPVSLYGVSKLIGEKAVRENLERHYIVRPARIFGVGGRNFASAIVNLVRDRKPIRAITDEVGSPTYARDLAERISVILSLGQAGIYHVTNSGQCSWYEFAIEVSRLLRDDNVSIEMVRSDDLRRPARRPLYTVMRCLLSEQLGLEPLRDWQSALIDFFTEVGAV